jgi:hypothetical protein
MCRSDFFCQWLYTKPIIVRILHAQLELARSRKYLGLFPTYNWISLMKMICYFQMLEFFYSMSPYLLRGFQFIQKKTVKETKRVNGLCGDRIQLSTLEKWQGETTCNQPDAQRLHCVIQSLRCNNEKQFLPRRSLRLKCALHLPHV